MNRQMIIRIDEKIKDEFNKLARSSGQTTSQVIRELIENYIKERDATQHINNLWNRISNEIKKNKVAEKDIPELILSSRKTKTNN